MFNTTIEVFTFLFTNIIRKKEKKNYWNSVDIWCYLPVHHQEHKIPESLLHYLVIELCFDILIDWDIFVGFSAPARHNKQIIKKLNKNTHFPKYNNIVMKHTFWIKCDEDRKYLLANADIVSKWLREDTKTLLWYSYCLRYKQNECGTI